MKSIIRPTLLLASLILAFVANLGRQHAEPISDFTVAPAVHTDAQYPSELTQQEGPRQQIELCAIEAATYAHIATRDQIAYGKPYMCGVRSLQGFPAHYSVASGGGGAFPARSSV